MEAHQDRSHVLPPSLQPDLYEVLDMQEKLEVKDGYVTLTRCFKHLGSWISNNLKDEYEIETRVKKAQAQMGALKPIFQCKYIDLAVTCSVYMAVPLNTVLWGCES